MEPLPLYTTEYILVLEHKTLYLELCTQLPDESQHEHDPLPDQANATACNGTATFNGTAPGNGTAYNGTACNGTALYNQLVRGKFKVILEQSTENATDVFEHVRTLCEMDFAAYNSSMLDHFELRETDTREFDFRLMKDVNLHRKYHRIRFVTNVSDDFHVVFGMQLNQLGRLGRSQIWVALIIVILTYVVLTVDKFPRLLVVCIADLLFLIFLAICSKFPTITEVSTMVDVETIMVLFGMMVLMSMFGRTGFFEWLAVKCFQISHGWIWLLGLIIAATTAAISTVLPNVTTIMLMAPVCLKICKAVDISPLPFLLASAMASNIGGTATLIGDPPNILIGSLLGLSFVDFLLHMLPGAIIVLIVNLLFFEFYFRWEWKERRKIDQALVEQYRITKKILLCKVAVVVLVVLVLFVSGSFFGLTPGWVSLLVSRSRCPAWNGRHFSSTSLCSP
eukprot:TRINITY_DN310_c2_g1_i8.p1 TRINITY_DN310_c2_g1~~TRINITY_DN310_c2_g1_i8.p1  ORF type:complete len:507 (-),score=131.51 TRINITY_DN310_c2_g1_i8:938-2290(-)